MPSKNINIDLEEQNLFLSKMLKIPYAPFHADDKAFVKLLSSALLKGVRVDMVYHDARKTFSAVAHKDEDLYLPHNHDSKFKLAVVTAIHNRLNPICRGKRTNKQVPIYKEGKKV